MILHVSASPQGSLAQSDRRQHAEVEQEPPPPEPVAGTHGAIFMVEEFGNPSVHHVGENGPFAFFLRRKSTMNIQHLRIAAELFPLLSAEETARLSCRAVHLHCRAVVQ